jgi:hypothetical protein
MTAAEQKIEIIYQTLKQYIEVDIAERCRLRLAARAIVRSRELKIDLVDSGNIIDKR